MIRGAAAICAFLFTNAAMACSCPATEPVGFVHATLTHLPSNARGVLFLTPYGNPPPKLNADDFTITSDQAPGALAVVISKPDISRESTLPALQDLLRIGPADGFRPGARYTIRYNGKPDRWAYPTTVDFVIDAGPLDLKSLSYALVVDGPPERGLLSLGDGRGSCASNQPVISQDFHYILPPSLQSYREAVAYFSQARATGSQQPYADRPLGRPLCESPIFAQTAREDGKDRVYVGCDNRSPAQTLRGWAGFLEVEDRLQATASVNIDLGKADGKACSGMGMLKEALANQEIARARATACLLSGEATFDGPFRPDAHERPHQLAATDLPSIVALSELTQGATPAERQCIEEAMRRVIHAMPKRSRMSAALDRWRHDEHADLRGILVMRNGRVTDERYYNGETAGALHDVRSAGKSITALLVGAAIDSGKIRSAAAPVGRYWPETKNSAIGDVSLADVLTMRSGLAAFDEDPASPGNEDKMDEAADPIAFLLAIPRETVPGTRYRYNSATAHIAGLMVEKATGQNLEDYARSALFAPLGITRWDWGRDAAGHPKGQGNLSLSARDLAKIGQMVLDKGVYHGRRVLSAAWIDAMLTPRVAIGNVDRYADSYGYFWYMKTQTVDGKPVPVFFASGNGGNKIYVVPSLKTVVVITSSAYGKGYGQLRSENILKSILAP